MTFEKEFSELAKEGGYMCDDGHERFNKGNIQDKCFSKTRVMEALMNSNSKHEVFLALGFYIDGRDDISEYLLNNKIEPELEE